MARGVPRLMVEDAAVATAGAALEGQAASIILLNRWVRAAASLLGCDSACIILSDAKIARVIARHNIPHAFLASERTLDKAPYGRDEIVILPDCRDRADIHAVVDIMAGTPTGCFYRRPLILDEGRAVSLLLFGERARPAFDARDLALVEEIAGAMAEEVERHYPSRARDLAASMRMTRPEIDRWLAQTDAAALLLDGDLVVRGANGPLRTLLPLDWDCVLGRTVDSFALPGGEAIERLFRHALQTGLSTPRLDLAIETDENGRPGRLLQVVASPLTPVDGGAMLVATLDPASLDRRGSDAAATPPDGEPAADFLLETLVRRRALRSRNGVSYVTLRSWRQPVREHQIKALRAIKRLRPDAIAAEIAAEIADDVSALFGAGGFRAVVPMPCGHSGPETCLSAAIARSLARILSLPVAHALAMSQEPGSSHPKTNAKRAPMRLAAPVEGPVLLVDDVATSGRHIEEASQLLRSQGPGCGVLAVAWIGGSADDKA